jgi:hypothetical protein
MFHKNTFMVNPYNNTLIFGKIPEIYHGRDYFPWGDIYLRYGEHKGINRGFGVVHIWQAHQKELLQLGYTEEAHVANFVSSIIQIGTPLFCEFNDVRGKHRITVLKSSTGVAILEQKSNAINETFYSVVTAFTRHKAYGIQIGISC